MLLSIRTENRYDRNFMCGITGIVHFNQERPVEREDIRRMNDRLVHRGPDGEGIWISGPVGLGHRRLSIIDLSDAGRQPMFNEDESIVLVFNGEIYNFQELRASLLDRGHRFRSNSDSEVILHLYEEKGIECLQQLRGMFAFAIWDEAKQRLFLARDRVGKKPLKYTIHNQRFIFASELKAILSLPGIPREEDEAAIHYYLNFGYCPAPYTGLKGIHKLPPAHYAVIENGTLHIERYWQLSNARKEEKSEEEWCEAIVQSLREAVTLRLISDVPLGVFLSGGLDSSVIAALMAQASPAPVKTFTIGFPESDFDETYLARKVAEKYSTDHHELRIEPKETDIFPTLVHLYEEPYSDSSALPTYYVAQTACRFVTVALNGDGGDENFVGYERYSLYEKVERVSRWLLPFGGKTVAEFLSRVPFLPSPFARAARAGRTLLDRDPVKRYIKYVSFFDSYLQQNLYSPDWLNRLARCDPTNYYRDSFLSPQAGHSNVERACYADFNNYLPGALLPKVDIATMAHSMESRSPFLDHTFLELTSTIPADLKLKNGEKKYIYRKAIRNLIPGELLRHRKMGFGIPIHDWFAGSLRTMAWDSLLGERARARGTFRAETIRGLLEEHDHEKNRGYYIWLLLALEEWRKQYLDAVP